MSHEQMNPLNSIINFSNQVFSKTAEILKVDESYTISEDSSDSTEEPKYQERVSVAKKTLLK